MYVFDIFMVTVNEVMFTMMITEDGKARVGPSKPVTVPRGTYCCRYVNKN
jgi:hypothetical protein